MDRIKRQRNCRRTLGIKLQQALDQKNCIENLSNEIFYEIFDYLDGYDIYQAFSNLNIRFQSFLMNSLFLLKINFSSESEVILDDRYKQFIDSNKSHILSLHFYNSSILDQFLNFCIIDSSFNRLESVVLNEISTFKLLVVLFYFKSLPRLTSLTVCLDICYDNLGDIYQIIFHLSFLKYLKIEITEYHELDITLPIATNEQMSPIEYLCVYHHCPLNDLIDILSYTPQLSHLYCFYVTESEGDIESDVLVKLINLVHLTISIHDFVFDEFEEFLLTLCSRLKFLSVTIDCIDKSYLDAERWERLIDQNIPFLEKLIYCYTDVIDEDFQIDRYHSSINGFTSSFWINRKWIFKLLVQKDELIYLIRPFIETWIDFQEYKENNIINSSNDYYPVIQLSISDTVLSKTDEPLTDKIHPIFDMIQLTCLDIHCDEMSVIMFIKILNLLPNLQSLRISDFPLHDPINSRDPEMNIWNQFLENNKITKLTLRNIHGIEDIFCIIILFPRIEYFSLQYVWNVDLELFVRCILLKIHENNIFHPMTICIFGVAAEFDKVHKLHQMIDEENLLKNYTINRRLTRFYLQWK